MTPSQQYIINKAVNKLNKKDQIMKAAEECCELAQAVLKSNCTQNDTNILTEISDVLIMIEQIKVIFNFSDEDITDEIDRKLQRLKTFLDTRKAV
jgi:NTP pyrophosphatase (non-canonical NTP hydrolase)